MFYGVQKSIRDMHLRALREMSLMLTAITGSNQHGPLELCVKPGLYVRNLVADKPGPRQINAECL